MSVNRKQLFPLGSVVATPDALSALADANESAMPLLSRHQSGDWGDLYEEDRLLNDEAVKDGSRILSSYVLEATGQKVWIISEADRSSTTILLPENY